MPEEADLDILPLPTIGKQIELRIGKQMELWHSYLRAREVPVKLVIGKSVDNGAFAIAK